MAAMSKSTYQDITVNTSQNLVPFLFCSNDSLLQFDETSFNAEAIALIDGFTAQSWSYNELRRDIRACAESLRSLGFMAGHSIALISENHPHLVIMFCAANLLGMF